MSKFELFSSFGMNVPITFRPHHGPGGKTVAMGDVALPITGRITGITLESGASAGFVNSHFMVKVATARGPVDLYVKTID